MKKINLLFKTMIPAFPLDTPPQNPYHSDGISLLKAIELVGLKSFADRTKLEFHDGITAIVGPNGSGKSNIVDAIKWVLGEQSMKKTAK